MSAWTKITLHEVARLRVHCSRDEFGNSVLTPGSRLRWLFVGVVSLVAACASAPPDRLELMPAPEVCQDGKVDPFEGLCPEGQ